MIELLTWATPNGSRPSIMLEEVQLPYVVRLVDITSGAQFQPEFLALNPNNKIPALIDRDGVGGSRTIFESGAILLYLAEKSGSLLAADGSGRDDALSWLFWATTGVGPTLGRFMQRATPHDGASSVTTGEESLSKEVIRLLHVLEKRLQNTAYLATDYSIADIAAFTWVQFAFLTIRDRLDAQFGPTPSTELWLKGIGARPAVQRGLRATKVVIHRNAPAAD